MPNSHLDSIAFQLCGYAVYISLPIMVGEQHFRLDDPRRIDQLLNRHGVGLVAGQESNIDILDVSHLGNVFSVAGNVDSQSVECENIAVVPSLGVELQMAFGGVVGWNSFNCDAPSASSIMSPLDIT